MNLDAATLTPTATTPSKTQRPKFTPRETRWMPLWLVLTANIYWMFWLYKTYKEIRQHSPTATTITPGQAVGLMFVPVFNIYWLFRVLHDFPRALARVQNQASPMADALPHGRITAMMVGAFVLNSFASFHPSMFVAGEILLVTALIVCQASMNEMRGEKILLHVLPRYRFADLIGASAPGWEWRRPAAFAVAAFLSLIPVSLINHYIVSGRLGLNLSSMAGNAVLAVTAALAAYLAFRHIRNEWLAALAAAAICGIAEIAVILVQAAPHFDRLSFVWLDGVIVVMSNFLLFASLAFFAHLTRSIWKAVLAGVAVSEFADTIAIVIYPLFLSPAEVLSANWYSALGQWISHGGPEKGSIAYIGATLGLLQPFNDLVIVLSFTFTLWLAHKLWVGEAMVPTQAAVFAGVVVPKGWGMQAAPTAGGFTEAQNLGTRHDRIEKATTYWMARVTNPRKAPYTMYLFDRGEDARAALLELPCIHEARDTGNLICTEVLTFGYYANEKGVYEALVCGDDLSYESWEQAKAAFEKHGGRLKNDLAPEKTAPPKAKAVPKPPGAVEFVREDRKMQMGQMLIYRIHRAPDAASAKAYLETHPVQQKLYYLIVETPEGNYCRDIDGMYKE